MSMVSPPPPLFFRFLLLLRPLLPIQLTGFGTTWADEKMRPISFSLNVLMSKLKMSTFFQLIPLYILSCETSPRCLISRVNNEGEKASRRSEILANVRIAPRIFLSCAAVGNLRLHAYSYLLVLCFKIYIISKECKWASCKRSVYIQMNLMKWNEARSNTPTFIFPK